MRRFVLLLALAVLPVFAQTAAVTWDAAQRQPAAWYGGPEAARIADLVLLYQRDNGGWDKNINMAAPLDEAARAKLQAEKKDGLATIDNGGTYTQMQFLAKVNQASKQDKYVASFRRGFEYLLKMQYPNGGWPQYYPPREGYYTHITYNDDAMINVMSLLRAVAQKKPEYAFLTINERTRAQRAIDRGLSVILKTQVLEDGRLTVWCAQHDERTFAPVMARTYEHPSLSGSESVGIVRYLMTLDKPSPEVVQAVHAAVAWLSQHKISGIRLVTKPAPGLPGGTDRVVEEDPAAPPIWARFYELGTGRPIFSGRDSVVKYSLAEIEPERRNGYSWYGTWPAKLITEEYPRWVGLR